jgi:hypothetical protein
MEAARTSETSVDNYFTRQYIPEDNSELQLADVRTWNLTKHFFVLAYNPVVRYQILTAASMKMRAFWDIPPCSLGVNRRDHPDDERSTHLRNVGLPRDYKAHYVPEGSSLYNSVL